MAEASAMVDDGYSMIGRVPAKPGLYPDVEFRYRAAATHHRLTHHLALQRDHDGVEQMDRLAPILVKHLETWNVRTRKGEPVPIKEANIKRLHGDVFKEIVDHVFGYSVTAAEDLGNSESGCSS